MTCSLLKPGSLNLPAPGQEAAWGRLIGASAALAATELAGLLAAGKSRPLLLLAEDSRHADQLEAECRFFAGDTIPIEHFVEWETLPWDSFSPYQDIVSQRLRVLSALPMMREGIIIATPAVLHQRLPPLDYIAARSLSLTQGQTLPREDFTRSLIAAGYLRVRQVSEHG